jgi:photosystem II stability/assembly factor-like uncharacterized protein
MKRSGFFLFALLLLEVSQPTKTSAQDWTKTGAPPFRWFSVASSADGYKLAAVRGYTNVYTSTDAGKTWVNHSVSTEWSQAVAMSADGNTIVVVSWKGGPILISSDAGESWKKTSAPNNYWASVACSADGSRILAAGSDAGDQHLFLSLDSGITWNKTGPSNYWNYVAASADMGKCFASSPNGLYRSIDSGVTWENVSNLSQYWGAIAASADGLKLVAIGGTNIFTSTDSGTTWNPSLTNSADWTSVASSADGTTLLAASRQGSIYTSKDSGLSWQPNEVPGGEAEQWRAVASSADGRKFIAASASNNDGSLWTADWDAAPSLVITRVSGKPELSWNISSTDFILEAKSDLDAAWTEITPQVTTNTAKLKYEVNLPSSDHNLFFRLKSP